MDYKVILTKKLPFILILTGGVTFSVMLLVLFFLPTAAKPNQDVKTVHTEIVSKWSFGYLMSIYGKAWLRIQSQVDDLRHAEEEKEKLRLENANLKLNVESLEFKCHSREVASTTETYELKLTEETGVRVGRSLSSIEYKPPSHLLPSQLYTLGMAYLNAREDEKAAVIFTTLTGLDKNDTYKTPKNYLLTGISWYRLENFTLSNFYFDEVLKKSEVSSAEQFQAQARLWKALIAKKLNKSLNSQYWLKELLEHHPHSTEANWINSAEVESEKRIEK